MAQAQTPPERSAGRILPGAGALARIVDLGDLRVDDVIQDLLENAAMSVGIVDGRLDHARYESSAASRHDPMQEIGSQDWLRVRQD